MQGFHTALSWQMRLEWIYWSCRASWCTSQYCQAKSYGCKWKCAWGSSSFHRRRTHFASVKLMAFQLILRVIIRHWSWEILTSQDMWWRLRQCLVIRVSISLRFSCFVRAEEDRLRWSLSVIRRFRQSQSSGCPDRKELSKSHIWVRHKGKIKMMQCERIEICINH